MDTSTETEEDSYSQEEVKPLPKKEYQKGYNLQAAIKNTTERMVPEVPVPSGYLPTDEEFWSGDKLPNCDYIKKHLQQEGKFQRQHILGLLDVVYEIYCAEDNVLEVPAPITVCGDVHGQFFDLLKLFEIGGDPRDTRFLFLGDYVDRGDFSVEVIILMFAYKCNYPTSFFMLRGNHECRHLTDHFTFKEECIHKYDIEVYDAIMDVFDALPLAAVMNNQFFCVHGGLSPHLSITDPVGDINAIDRFVEPPSSGLMCDLLWADPEEDYSVNQPTTFKHNGPRGTSHIFGYKAVVDLLNRNKWLSVIRAHESQVAGYKMYDKNAKTGFPSLITIFSAPNYCTQYNNKAAIMKYENNSMTIKQFTDTVHPYFLPSFMNVFEWSLPFVAEKVGELLLGVFKMVNDDEEETQEAAAQAEREELARKREAIRRKVQVVSKMLSVFAQMREEHNQQLALTGLNIPEEEKKTVVNQLKTASKQDKFSLVKKIDGSSEARPKDGLDQALSPMSQSSDAIGHAKRLASRERILQMRSNSPKNSPRRMSDPPPAEDKPVAVNIEEAKEENH